MTWRTVPAAAAFAGFAAAWDRLNQKLYAGHPFFDSRFIGPLLECFGNGRELLCVHETGAEIDGALILHPLRSGRWALFLPAQTQAGAVLLADARHLETLLPALPGHAWSLDLLSIDPAYSPDWTGLSLPRTTAPHTLTMAVELTGDFDGYWRNRPRNLVKNLRRYRHRAEEQSGPLSVSVVVAAEEMRAALTRYGELESAGWKGEAGTAIAIDNVQGRFYERTLGAFAATGQAMVMEMRVGDRLVASRLFIVDGQMWIILKTTYDESMAALAPGRQLLHEVLQRAFLELPGGSVEFYTNATRDQAEWATSLRYIAHHQLFRGDLAAVAYGATRHLRDGLRHRTARQGTDKSSRHDPRSVTSCHGIEDLPPAAQTLLDSTSRTSIDCSSGWFRNLQNTAFAGDPGVRYFVMDFDGRPSAILPLRLQHSGRVRSVMALSNYYTSVYAPVFADGATAVDLVPLIEAADREHGGAHVMRFSPMDPTSPAFEALLTALRTLGWIPFRYFTFGNWHLPVGGSWQDYLLEREGRLRNTLRRMARKFEAEGGSLQIVTEPAELPAASRAFQEVYALSWKKPEPCQDFVPGLMNWLAARGELRLGVARLHGRPIAAQLWAVSRGTASIFKLAHDERYAGFSPGSLLTAHLMEHVMESDRVREVDYLIGDDPYKQLWMSHRRERWGIVAYNPRTMVGLAMAAREVVGRTLRRLMNWRHPGHGAVKAHAFE